MFVCVCVCFQCAWVWVWKHVPMTICVNRMKIRTVRNRYVCVCVFLLHFKCIRSKKGKRFFTVCSSFFFFPFVLIIWIEHLLFSLRNKYVFESWICFGIFFRNCKKKYLKKFLCAQQLITHTKNIHRSRMANIAETRLLDFQ